MNDIAQKRARKALKLSGLDEHLALERASSHANEAWLGRDFVLRVNARGDLGRLEREAKVARALPPEARYPGVIAYGSEGELEWLLVKRVRGVDLSRAWPALDEASRERAARELASVLRALHEVRSPGLPSEAELDPPHTLPLERLLALIDAARSRGLEAGLLDEVEGFVRDRWDAFDGAGRGLVHGDPHLENVLWDGEHVSALIDLEWSRESWLEVDLEILLAFADHPFLFLSADYEASARSEDYANLTRWLRAEDPAWFSHPRLHDRLAVLHLSRTLGLWLESPAAGPRDPLDGHDRRNHLRAVLDGTARWLAPVG